MFFCDDGFDIRKGIRIFVQKRIYNITIVR